LKECYTDGFNLVAVSIGSIFVCDSDDVDNQIVFV